jgi:hypothetical protein
MKKLLVAFLLLSAEAKAWQLNASLVLNNPNTESCIVSTYKVGDKLRSPIGSSSYSIIRSLSGTSSRCQTQTHPILANVETVIGVSPNFQMEVPDDYKAYPITDVDKFNGTVLNAGSGNDGYKWLYVFIRQRETSITPEAIIQATLDGATPLFKEAPVIKNQEELIINGMRAWRFEMIGATKKIFAPSLTYLCTMLEGDNEYVFIQAYTKTSNYEEDKKNLSSLAYKVSGIKSNAKSEASIEEAKGICKSLGLKEKTEKFGICVLEHTK